MSRHTTYRGTTIDMDSIRRENEHVTALGNMRVNAKGDQISGGVVTKSADQIARENHRVQTSIIRSGLKGPITEAEPVLEKKKVPVQATTKAKEQELPNGDIIIDEGKNK